MKTAAIYARVSSDKQKEENTIASQTAELIAFARQRQFEVLQEWVFEDDGYSGASLIRPGLERVSDLAAEGMIHELAYDILVPDRVRIVRRAGSADAQPCRRFVVRKAVTACLTASLVVMPCSLA
jgi:DNA invertase Pin-like site-specific DNA recombinase